MKVIKAIYNFFVGDMTILIGVIITMLVLALISYVGALAPLPCWLCLPWRCTARSGDNLAK